MTSRTETKRINLYVPQDLIDLVHKMADKHIPPPTKTDFYIYLIKSGLTAWDNGTRVRTPAKLKFAKPKNKFQHYIPVTLVQRFHIAVDTQDPRPKTSQFLVHIMRLAIEQYRRDYNQYGIKRN